MYTGLLFCLRNSFACCFRLVMLNATLTFSLFHIDTEYEDKKRGKQVKIFRNKKRKKKKSISKRKEGDDDTKIRSEV